MLTRLHAYSAPVASTALQWTLPHLVTVSISPDAGSRGIVPRPSRSTGSEADRSMLAARAFCCPATVASGRKEVAPNGSKDENVFDINKEYLYI